MVVDRITRRPARHCRPGAQKIAVSETGGSDYELLPEPDDPPDDPELEEPDDPLVVVLSDALELESLELLPPGEELALPLSLPDFLA